MTSPRQLSTATCVCLATIAAVAILGIMWTAPESVMAERAAQQPAQPAQPAQTPLASLSPGLTLEGPFTHANLTLYVVRGSTSDAREYITLDEGLAARTVAVREKSAGGQDRAEVNSLEIENKSDKWLFLQAGDIVKGGKQDRTIMTDLTLAPRSGPQPIEAFCVEHGRWTASGDGMAFRSNTGIVSGAPLKIAIQGEKNQSRVWEEVKKAEGRAATVARGAGASVAAESSLSTTGTYNAIAEHKTLNVTRDAYVTALLPQIKKHADAIGLAIAINGHVTSADVYGSPALFQRLSGKLLNSYALEGVLAQDTSQQATAPTKQQVIAFLSTPVAARPATETVGRSMQRSTRETDEVVMYEYRHVSQPTSPKPEPVHQSYLKKSKQ